MRRKTLEKIGLVGVMKEENPPEREGRVAGSRARASTPKNTTNL